MPNVRPSEGMLAANLLSTYNALNASIYYLSLASASPAGGQVLRQAVKRCKTIRTIEINVFDQKLLKTLRCPLSQSLLTLADSKLVDQINQGIKTGQVVNLGGHRLEQRIDTGLVREAGDILYPVIDAIPVMLPDEAVDLLQLEDG